MDDTAPLWLRVQLRRPGDLDSPSIDRVTALVADREAVNVYGLRRRIQSSLVIAILTVGERIVSTGSIKNPRDPYVESVKAKSGFPIPASTRELGYIATDKAFRGRGFAQQIYQRLSEGYAEPLFATTSDRSIQRILGRLDFNKVGTSWTSETAFDSLLTLWIRLAH